VNSCTFTESTFFFLFPFFIHLAALKCPPTSGMDSQITTDQYCTMPNSVASVGKHK